MLLITYTKMLVIKVLRKRGQLGRRRDECTIPPRRIFFFLKTANGMFCVIVRRLIITRIFFFINILRDGNVCVVVLKLVGLCVIFLRAFVILAYSRLEGFKG